MPDIELVIRIPEEMYYLVQNKLDFNGDLYKQKVKTLMLAIDNGVSLSKGHGDLIDKNKLAHKMVVEDVSRFKEEPEALAGLFLRMCDKEQPIIEADNVESEDRDLGL